MSVSVRFWFTPRRSDILFFATESDVSDGSISLIPAMLARLFWFRLSNCRRAIFGNCVKLVIPH